MINYIEFVGGPMCGEKMAMPPDFAGDHYRIRRLPSYADMFSGKDESAPIEPMTGIYRRVADTNVFEWEGWE